jgi:hypothetical protein
MVCKAPVKTGAFFVNKSVKSSLHPGTSGAVVLWIGYDEERGSVRRISFVGQWQRIVVALHCRHAGVKGRRCSLDQRQSQRIQRSLFYFHYICRRRKDSHPAYHHHPIRSIQLHTRRCFGMGRSWLVVRPVEKVFVSHAAPSHRRDRQRPVALRSRCRCSHKLFLSFRSYRNCILLRDITCVADKKKIGAVHRARLRNDRCLFQDIPAPAFFDRRGRRRPYRDYGGIRRVETF